MVWLMTIPMVIMFEDMIIRFDRIHERTDGRTDGETPHDDIGRACIACQLTAQDRDYL